MNPFWILFWTFTFGPVVLCGCIGMVHWVRTPRRRVPTIPRYYALDDGAADYYHMGNDPTRDLYWLPPMQDPWAGRRV